MIWKVTFEDKHGEFTLEFVDLSTQGKVIFLQRNFIDEFINKIKKLDHYQVAKAIKRVISYDNTNLSPNRIYALLAVTKEEYRLGFLFFTAESGAIILVGAWPEEFAKKIKDNISVFEGALASIVEDPFNWVRVDFLLSL